MYIHATIYVYEDETLVALDQGAGEGTKKKPTGATREGGCIGLHTCLFQDVYI